MIYNPSKENASEFEIVQLSVLFIESHPSFKRGILGIGRNLAAATEGLPWVIYFSWKWDKLSCAEHHVFMSGQTLILRLSHFKLAKIPTPYGSLQDSYGPLN